MSLPHTSDPYVISLLPPIPDESCSLFTFKFSPTMQATFLEEYNPEDIVSPEDLTYIHLNLQNAPHTYNQQAYHWHRTESASPSTEEPPDDPTIPGGF
jgi:hypothetical protein